MTESGGGFRIKDEFFPFPLEYDYGKDPYLVKELIGLSWKQYLDLAKGEKANAPLVKAVALAFAFRQKYPEMPPFLIVRKIKSVRVNDIEVVAPSGPPA